MKSQSFAFFYISPKDDDYESYRYYHSHFPLYYYQIKETGVIFLEIPSKELDTMPFIISCDKYQTYRRVFPGIYWDVFRMRMDDTSGNDKTHRIYKQVYAMKYEENGKRDWYDNAGNLLLHIPMSAYRVDTASILEGTLDKRRLGFNEVFPKQIFDTDTIFDKRYKYPELDTTILSLPGKVFREKYLKGEISLPLH